MPLPPSPPPPPPLLLLPPLRLLAPSFGCIFLYDFFFVPSFDFLSPCIHPLSTLPSTLFSSVNETHEAGTRLHRPHRRPHRRPRRRCPGRRPFSIISSSEIISFLPTANRNRRTERSIESVERRTGDGRWDDACDLTRRRGNISQSAPWEWPPESMPYRFVLAK